jgi:hypothetical protein
MTHPLIKRIELAGTMTGKPFMKIPVLLIVIVLLVALTGCAGCIKAVQNGLGGENVTESTNLQDSTDLQAALTTPTPVAVPVLTPVKSDIVTEVAPYITPNPYITQHGVRINSTPQYRFLYRQPEFTQTYTLSESKPVGLLVNVAQGPLYVVYTVKPKNDCLKDSCRGSINTTVNRPYMTITVRDNQTKEIVAEDGYAREFSSDTGNYEFTITTTSDDNSDTSDDSSDTESYTSEPGPRYIPVYKEGQFLITIEGDYLDVTVSIITGASPDPLEMAESSGASSSSQNSDSDDWE